MIARTASALDPSTLDPVASARRRLRHIANALAKVERDFAALDRRSVNLGLRATHLRAEREALREILDRKAEGGRI